MQAGYGFLDAPQGFDDVLVARGITHAEALGRAEGIAADGGHVCLFEQEHGEIHAVVDDAVATLLTEIGAALGEQIERSMRIVHLEARHFLGQLHDELLAAFEGAAHLLHALLRTGEQ